VQHPQLPTDRPGGAPASRRRPRTRAAAGLVALATALGGGVLGVASPALAAPGAGGVDGVTDASGTTVTTTDAAGVTGVRAADGQRARLVNPFVGTEDEGNAFPGATAPFGMVQLSPDNTNSYQSTSYSKDAGEVWGFSHQHVNSAGCPAAGEVLVTPSTGDDVVTERRAIALRDQATTEKASAGSYGALLDDGVGVELTASTRVGEHRYTFPAGADGHVSFNVGQTLRDAGASEVTWVDDSTLEGYVDAGGFCGGTDEKVRYHFSATFDRPTTSHGTWGVDGAYLPGSEASTVDAGLNGAVATFDTTTDDTVEVSVGVSFVDVEGARANRLAETTDPGDGARLGFDAVRAATEAAWDDELGRIDVTVGSEDELRVFTTQLYKSLLSPTVGSDVDGRYLGMDLQPHVAEGWTYHQRFSLWDTYRTQATLHALFESDRAEDVVRSMHAARVQGGWFPRWSLGALETNIMAGDPVSPWLAENFALGTVPDDLEDELWGQLVENATTAPPADVASVGRQSAAFYLENGHVPWYAEDGGGLGGEYEEYRHGGSATMEFAVADAAIGAAAQRTGRDDESEAFLDRGRNWRNLWNPDVELTGGFRGIVNAVGPDGSFQSVPELSPVQQSGFHEGVPWNYQWMAPQDVPGLVDAMGGRDAFVERLDAYVDLPALRAQPGVSPEHWAAGGSDYYSGVGYNPGNEPMLGTAWLYGSVCEPAKTNDVLAAALARFPDAPGGGVGNDDLGTLSSWYVLASLGMMPVQPGSGIMAVNAPRVQHATVTLDSGATVTVDAPAASGTAPRYVRGLTIDGEPTTAAWFDVAELQDGATLAFDLATSPEGLTWGTGPEDAVPSVSAYDTAELDVAPASDAPVAARAGEPVEVDLATVTLTPTTPDFPATAGVTPSPASISDEAATLAATVDLGDGPVPATLVRVPDDAPGSAGGAAADGTSAGGAAADGTSATAADGAGTAPAADVSVTAVDAPARWTVRLATTFAAPGDRTAVVTVAGAGDLPAYAPEPFDPASTTVTVAVADAAVAPGPGDPGAGGPGAGAPGAGAPGAGSPGDGAPGAGAGTGSSSAAGTGALAWTGSAPGLAVAAVLALLAVLGGAVAVTRRRRSVREG